MRITSTLYLNGVEYVAEIATVEATFLGREDHGIFTAQLTLSSGSWGQVAGGYALDAPSDRPRRIGTAFGLDHIIAIIDVLGCGDWEHVKGSRCFAIRDEDQSSSIVGLADLTAQRALIFKQHADTFATSAVSA